MITNFVEAIISNKPPISQQVWKKLVPQALWMQFLFPSRKAEEKSGKDVDVKQNEALFLDSSNSQHGERQVRIRWNKFSSYYLYSGPVEPICRVNRLTPSAHFTD